MSLTERMRRADERTHRRITRERHWRNRRIERAVNIAAHSGVAEKADDRLIEQLFAEQGMNEAMDALNVWETDLEGCAENAVGR